MINSPHEHEGAIFLMKNMKEQFSNEEHEGAILTHYILRSKELRFEHFNVLLLPQNSFLQNKKMYGSMELGLQGC